MEETLYSYIQVTILFLFTITVYVLAGALMGVRFDCILKSMFCDKNPKQLGTHFILKYLRLKALDSGQV